MQESFSALCLFFAVLYMANMTEISGRCEPTNLQLFSPLPLCGAMINTASLHRDNEQLLAGCF